MSRNDEVYAAVARMALAVIEDHPSGLTDEQLRLELPLAAAWVDGAAAALVTNGVVIRDGGRLRVRRELTREEKARARSEQYRREDAR